MQVAPRRGTDPGGKQLPSTERSFQSAQQPGLPGRRVVLQSGIGCLRSTWQHLSTMTCQSCSNHQPPARPRPGELEPSLWVRTKSRPRTFLHPSPSCPGMSRNFWNTDRWTDWEKRREEWRGRIEGWIDMTQPLTNPLMSHICGEPFHVPLTSELGWSHSPVAAEECGAGGVRRELVSERRPCLVFRWRMNAAQMENECRSDNTPRKRAGPRPQLLQKVTCSCYTGSKSFVATWSLKAWLSFFSVCLSVRPFGGSIFCLPFCPWGQVYILGLLPKNLPLPVWKLWLIRDAQQPVLIGQEHSPITLFFCQLSVI